MKREILFRAQKFDNKLWVEGDLIHAVDGLFIRQQNKPNLNVPIISKVNTETICQFTGLTDKNRTKIFEGDIIKIFWDDDYSEETITYDCKYGYYMYGNNPICELIGDNEFEVIGNIFDSSELLK